MDNKAWIYGSLLTWLINFVSPFVHETGFSIQLIVGYKRSAFISSLRTTRRIKSRQDPQFICHSVSSMNDKTDHEWTGNDTLDMLRQLRLDSRLHLVESVNLPVVAEYYAQGKWGLCLITGFKDIQHTHQEKKRIPPSVEIIIVNTTCADGSMERRIVDVGQITTIWDPDTNIFEPRSDLDSYLAYLQNIYFDAMSSLGCNFPVHHIESCMETIHKNRQKTRQKGLSKKSVASQIDPNHPAQDIVRSILKTGPGMNRLIDSSEMIEYLYEHIPSNVDSISDVRRLVSAEVIFRDFSLGGRFKRFPSIFVHKIDQDTVPGEMDRFSVAIVNGGWLVVDSSSRATLEGQKFADRINTESLRDNICVTSADERIVCRLEALAMGDTSFGENEASQLLIDVRQTLSALKFPLSPIGARMALVQMGKWSESDALQSSKGKMVSDSKVINPWSKEVLSVAKDLALFMKRKREDLTVECDKICHDGIKDHVDGRVVLTKLPVVCIDAQRTTFRDDSLSLRPRSMTGRKILNNARWEILIHVADVSDVYCPPITDTRDFSILLKAAESRSVSRYDLPVGPLHLMPPQALEALSFQCRKNDETQSTTNICVTVWAYLDEESGRLLDSGIERSVIAAPTAFTYDSANDLIMNDEEKHEPIHTQRSRQILKIAERLLLSWNINQIENNVFAQKREARLNARRAVAESIYGNHEMRDDGSQGSFQRSRSHRIVDISLDLYSFVLTGHLTRAKVPFPRLAANNIDRRGRIGTAPLRRYVDGLAQRQAVSSLCHFGGPIMNLEECSTAAKKATDVVNKARNHDFRKDRDGSGRVVAQHNEKRIAGLKQLQQHIKRNGKVTAVPAVCTGKDNDVIILGLGIKVKCDGVNGTLHPGERVLVRIANLQVEKGLLKVSLYERGEN